MLTRRSVFLLGLLSAFTSLGAVSAQSSPAPAYSTWQPAHWTGIFGFHLGSPDKYSVVLGVGRVLTSRPLGAWETAKHVQHSDRDVYFVAEPGKSGMRVALGYGGLKDLSSRGATMVSGRLSAYRRWKDDSSRVYIGPEFSASGVADIALGLRTGVLVQATGPRAAKRLLIPIDFAVGW
jgi:hypothetical protein